MAKKPQHKGRKKYDPVGSTAFAKLAETHNPKSTGNKIGYLFIFLFVAPFFIPSLVLLVIALSPSMVALFIDRSNNRYAGITILGCNLAGTMPSLVDLWLGNNNTLNGALDEVLQVFHLIVILGSAGVGWLMYGAAPSVVAVLMRLSSARHVAMLSSKQRALIIDWGEEVMFADAVVEDTPANANGAPPAGGTASLAMPTGQPEPMAAPPPPPPPALEAEMPVADAAQ